MAVGSWIISRGSLLLQVGGEESAAGIEAPLCTESAPSALMHLACGSCQRPPENSQAARPKHGQRRQTPDRHRQKTAPGLQRPQEGLEVLQHHPVVRDCFLQLLGSLRSCLDAQQTQHAQQPARTLPRSAAQVPQPRTASQQPPLPLEGTRLRAAKLTSTRARVTACSPPACPTAGLEPWNLSLPCSDRAHSL